jgi:hypothetical protein
MYKYEFDTCIDKKYSDYPDCREQGAAFLYFENHDYGAEYEFCRDNGKDNSTIYLTVYDRYRGRDEWRTDYACAEHYEIDFSNKNWKKDLERKMHDFVAGHVRKKKAG